MRRMKPMPRKKPSSRPCIRIYTTQAVLEAVAIRAAEEHRSVSKHGEYLLKRDLAIRRADQLAS